MKETYRPAAQLLRPILDTYRSSAIAVVGCHARGIERPSCELDVILITSEKRPNSAIRMGEVFIDLSFVSEKEALRPANDEHAVSLAYAMTVRDTSLILSTSIASNQAILSNSARRSSNHRLATALKSLGRAEDALYKGNLVNADYWLLSAAYDYAFSLLYSREIPPSPSHLLSQLKDQAGKIPRSYESFSNSAGLANSSRSSCRSRLEGLGVLYDVLGRGYEHSKAVRSLWSTPRFDCISSKARELNQRVEHAECYSYLGMEVLNVLRQLMTQEWGISKARVGPSTFTEGANRLLADQLFVDMGFLREGDTLKESLEVLRSQVSRLARKS